MQYDTVVAKAAGVRQIEVTSNKFGSLVSVIYTDGEIVRNRNNTTSQKLLDGISHWKSARNPQNSNVVVYYPYWFNWAIGKWE